MSTKYNRTYDAPAQQHTYVKYKTSAMPIVVGRIQPDPGKRQPLGAQCQHDTTIHSIVNIRCVSLSLSSVIAIAVHISTIKCVMKFYVCIPAVQMKNDYVNDT